VMQLLLKSISNVNTDRKLKPTKSDIFISTI